ncbi:MAG TPA: hypothetical protein VEU96_26535 [Bryobacteraceae bacterium]|nr:hypothetical protein [Bryobacteraceae bacterium]
MKQEPRLTMEEIGTDIPIGVAPAHTVISLKDKRPLPALDRGPRYFSPSYSSIAIVPLKDPSVKSFAKSYPDVAPRSIDVFQAPKPTLTIPKVLGVQQEPPAQLRQNSITKVL